jgi:aryl-alcohol dehydrogenase-like predicted oxidoreductase
MTMHTRTLGRSGFPVSEVGLGCWQFGGDFGAMEESEAQSILEAAVANGVDFFDTADVYGDGRSEKIIGEFLKNHPVGIRVATKFGRGGGVYPNGYSESALRGGIEASLERLGVDQLDLVQLHCIPTQTLRDGVIFDWLRNAQRDGLIRHFGASVETVEEGLLCLEQDGLLSLQIILNVLRQKPVAELLPQARAKGVGIIVRLPLASGLLSGKFTHETTFANTDHRNYNADGQRFNVGETFAGIPFPIGVDLVNALRAFVPETLTLSQMALRWILDQEAVSSIIPGASSPAQAAANAAIADLPPLSPDLHPKLREFYETRVHRNIRGPY